MSQFCAYPVHSPAPIVGGAIADITRTVSPEGVVAGSYVTPDGASHGYICGINSQGEIVGSTRLPMACSTGPCLRKRNRRPNLPHHNLRKCGR